MVPLAPPERTRLKAIVSAQLSCTARLLAAQEAGPAGAAGAARTADHLDIPMRSSYCCYLKTLFRFPSLTLRNSFGQGGLQLGGWWCGPCGHRAVRDDAATTSTESSPVHCLGPDLQAHNALLVCLLLASLPIAAREARAEPAPGSSPDSVSPQSPPDVCAMAAVLRLLTRPPPGPGPTRAKHNLLMESEGGGCAEQSKRLEVAPRLAYAC